MKTRMRYFLTYLAFIIYVFCCVPLANAQLFSFNVGYSSSLVGVKGLNDLLAMHKEMHPDNVRHYGKMNFMQGISAGYTVLGRHGFFMDGQLGWSRSVSTSVSISDNPNFPNGTKIGSDVRLSHLAANLTVGVSWVKLENSKGSGIMFGLRAEPGTLFVGRRVYEMGTLKGSYWNVYDTYFIRGGPAIIGLYAISSKLVLQAQIFCLLSPLKWDSSEVGMRTGIPNPPNTSNSNHCVGVSFFLGFGKVGFK